MSHEQTREWGGGGGFTHKNLNLVKETQSTQKKHAQAEPQDAPKQRWKGHQEIMVLFYQPKK